MGRESINNRLATVMAHLLVPTFSRVKKHLDAVDIEKPKSQVHVEKVIGSLMQKYTFFNCVVPVGHLTAPEGDIPRLLKNVVICLINLNVSVVTFGYIIT